MDLVKRIIDTDIQDRDLEMPLAVLGIDSMSYITFIVESENMFDIEFFKKTCNIIFC